MACLDVKEFTTVETSKGPLHQFVDISKRLVDEYIKIAEVKSAKISPIRCNDLGNVNKVFSHSIRAFLSALDLEYRLDDPININPGDITKVFTTNNDLLKYIDKSDDVVVIYGEITLATPETKEVTCNDRAEVSKVFSQAARVFLGWEKLVYIPGEPVNQY